MKFFLINLGAFFSMVPYAAPFPVVSDVQYPVIITSMLVILIDLINKKIYLNHFEQFFLFVSLLSFVYINPFVDFQYSIPKRFALLAAFMIFFVYSKYWRMINPKYLLFGILLNFCAAMVQLVSPDIFEHFSIFIGRAFTVNGLSAERGLTGLSAEPAYLGGLSIVYFLIVYVLKIEGRISKEKFAIFSCIALVLNILSMSGTASFMALITIFSLFLFADKKIYFKLYYILVITLFFYVVFYQLEISGRYVKFLNSLISNDPVSFFISDYSAAMRGMSLSVGIETILQGKLFGNGVGTLGVMATDMMQGTYLYELFILAAGREGESFSSVGGYVFELGLWFLVMILWGYFHSLKSGYTGVVRFSILLFLISSFSVMFPPFWILMAATDKRLRCYATNSQRLLVR